MNEKTLEVSFMGLEIQKDGPNDLILKALGTSSQLLDLEEFMTATNFKKDPIMNDYFWQIMVTKQRTHLSALLLECLGYEGEFRVQQQHFKRFLKSNNIHPQELSSSDPCIKNYTTIVEEMKHMKPNVIATRKWLIVEPKEFKKVIMKLNTKHGDRIREYYISVEELLRLYLEYCLYFKDRESKREITTLEQKLERMNLSMTELKDEMTLSMDELKIQNEEHVDKLDILVDQNGDLSDKLDTVAGRLGIAVEDRAPRLKRAAIRERFVLFKKNQSTNELYQYYAIRGQSVYINGRLSKLKSERFPNMTMLIDIICQPNPRNLFLRFKEHIDGKPEWEDNFTYAGNNVGCTTALQPEMVNIFMTLDEEKRDV